jgi:sugar lactone lactonase YvrE
MVIAAFMLFGILLFIYQINITRYENKGEIGRSEIFAKGIIRPQGMALDAEGRIFVQSAFDGMISMIKKDGSAMDYTYIDDYYGYGIELDASNNFIIAMEQQVAILNSSGYLLKSIEKFSHAYDVAKGPNNTIFVSDSDTNTIYRISSTYEVTAFVELGDKKSNTVHNAAGICFDKDFRNLYAVNMYKGDLYKIALSSDYEIENIDIIASNLKRPNFIDVDEDENVFISCLGDNTLVRVNHNSIKEIVSTKGKMSSPSGIVISNSGNAKTIYAASSDNNSIYKISIGSNN